MNCFHLRAGLLYIVTIGESFFDRQPVLDKPKNAYAILKKAASSSKGAGSARSMAPPNTSSSSASSSAASISTSTLPSGGPHTPVHVIDSSEDEWPLPPAAKKRKEPTAGRQRLPKDLAQQIINLFKDKKGQLCLTELVTMPGDERFPAWWRPADRKAPLGPWFDEVQASQIDHARLHLMGLHRKLLTPEIEVDKAEEQFDTIWARYGNDGNWKKVWQFILPERFQRLSRTEMLHMVKQEQLKAILRLAEQRLPEASINTQLSSASRFVPTNHAPRQDDSPLPLPTNAAGFAIDPEELEQDSSDSEDGERPTANLSIGEKRKRGKLLPRDMGKQVLELFAAAKEGRAQVILTMPGDPSCPAWWRPASRTCPSSETFNLISGQQTELARLHVMALHRRLAEQSSRDGHAAVREDFEATWRQYGNNQVWKETWYRILPHRFSGLERRAILSPARLR